MISGRRVVLPVAGSTKRTSFLFLATSRRPSGLIAKRAPDNRSDDRQLKFLKFRVENVQAGRRFLRRDSNVVSRTSVNADPVEADVADCLLNGAAVHRSRTHLGRSATVDRDDQAAELVEGNTGRKKGASPSVVELKDAHSIGVGRARQRLHSASVDVAPASEPAERRAPTREGDVVQPPPDNVCADAA
eukprot:TRINITY_DN1941_c0_g7_i1.p1 TRINITY_DN1941_c0_g7~~TRINITY_DN1941_c0_g7_i1.p1  ORF type:complete len:213 (-),score=17.44 TRINITY_DN1941_c0_g7_i1:292-858(-)